MKQKIIGLLLTVILVASAYVERGYFAIGSEWLVIPLIKLIKLYVGSWRDFYYEYQRSKC